MGDHVLVGRCVLHLQVEIGEALEEDAQELDPGIRVQRGGPDALRRVPDVIGHPEAGLAGVVTGVERVDPLDGGGPIVLRLGRRGCS